MSPGLGIRWGGRESAGKPGRGIRKKVGSVGRWGQRSMAGTRTQGILFRVIMQLCAEVPGWGGKWVEISPKLYSLNKLYLCWQHPEQDWASNRMRPVLRGQGRSVSLWDIWGRRRKSYILQRLAAAAAGFSRTGLSCKDLALEGGSVSRPFLAGRKPRQVFRKHRGYKEP